MATTPERPPQPLHNFFLPQLRWGNNSASNHRFRRRDYSHTHRPNQISATDSESPQSGSRPLVSSAGKQPPSTPSEANEAEKNGVAAIPEEGEARTWNLRPRRVSTTASFRNGEIWGSEEGYHCARKRKQDKEEDEEMKRKLWISLTKEEIEEDVYSMTGSRPARRPKKRPRNVQKLINNVFPGTYLVGLSADSYRLHE